MGNERRQEAVAADQRPVLARAELHSHGAEARRGDHRGARPFFGSERGECRHRPYPRLDVRHARRRLGHDGRRFRRQLRDSRRRHLRLPGDHQGRAVPDRQGDRDQRFQPQAHGRHAQGAARGARRHSRAAEMSSNSSAGERFREALKKEQPLQIIGTINAYHARLAKRTGYRAIYLSGGGVAAGSLGMPDLGISNLDDVLTDIRRITDVCDLPLLVDVDTGFGASAFNVARTTRSLIKAGAAAMHMEDQVGAKRCGHRPGKELVSTAEMADRIKAAVDARTDPGFVVMARTDALANEGLDAAVERARKYVEAGADMIFPEAVTDLPMYKRFADAVKVPILANITEFGKSPLFTVEELRSANVAMILYPLTAFRAMNKAALRAYGELRKSGTQKGVIADMQTREELYDIINYHSYEKKLDELFSRGRS